MIQAAPTASSLLQQTLLWAALSLSLLGSAQALTLARPVVQSKQGEALRAEIDISEITQAERTGLQASIASAEAYKTAQLDLPLSNGIPMAIEVQLLRRPNGTPYLVVTSQQAVDARAVDVLIDLRWAAGRLLRDFNLSIDDANANTNLIQASAVVGGVNPSTQQITVQYGDTASALVASDKPAGVSLEQMLVTLLRSNPDAFVESNVNRMKAGALITLPTEQDARNISRREAQREIQIQAKDFETYRAELAARAPSGTVPQVARDGSGQLKAKVHNSAKTHPDKLTLAKPGSQDTTADQIAVQRAAQDVVNRAAELSRNIRELGKIAAATATDSSTSEPALGTLTVNAPASVASVNGEWLNALREHSLTPVGAGSLITILVLTGLWCRRAMNKANGDHHMDEPTDDDHATTHRDVLRPIMEMPNISLDLDDPTDKGSANPHQVQIDLAEELWQLGQLHTSRALMEEVANEASGADKEKALQWLAERG